MSEKNLPSHKGNVQPDREQHYRPDIQGLRALAVISVLLFHLGTSHFSGGYVGVDIFFVISGFLITGNIRRSLVSPNRPDAGSFFSNFYLARARRILPALFATLIATFAVGALLLAPDHLQRLGGATIAAAFSLSNVFFWSEAGYWDASRLVKPLLHTWSLGVEEQFYLVWPAVLYLTARRGRWIAPTAIAILGLASLAGAEWWRTADASAVFYLSPFRVSEFAVGALMTWVPRLGDRRVAEPAYLLGVAAMIAAVLFFTEDSPVPGIGELLPCLGAALAILAAPAAPGASRLLSNPPAIFIGGISYSLYLVHWPVIVFWQYYRIVSIPTWTDQAGMAALSLVLALLLYFAVEQPLRGGGSLKLSPRRFGLLILVAVCAAAVPAASAWSQQGWTWREAPALQAIIADNLVHGIRTRPTGPCHVPAAVSDFKAAIDHLGTCNHLAPHSIVVVGDSDAGDLYMALATSSQANLVQLTVGGCEPYITDAPACHAIEKYATDYVAANASQIRGVFYTQVGASLNEKTIPVVIAFLKGLAAAGVPVVWFGPQMEYRPDVPTLLSQAKDLHQFVELANQHQLATILSLDRQIPAALAGSGIAYVSKIDALCPSKVCPLLDDEGQLLVPDYGHWGQAGQIYFGRLLAASSPPLPYLSGAP